MILKYFLLGNLLSLCMKIINSVVVVGLYYGFLTTFSIGPSYLFLLRARVMKEGTEKEVSATTGFIAGQLMMFISIYYAPLHLALGRPHTITVLVLPYLLFHFFWNNHKHFFDYGSTTRNSMRNLSIQCVFLNNLIFQLFNHFILPSSTLTRLVNIYMFRCNNKMLFVTSSFVGWLIGHILFMKWVGLVLFWIRHSIRSNKYLVSELRNSMARIFSILLFITCLYYLGRMPSPIFTKKLRGESEEETDVEEIETTSKTKGTKQEQEGSTEEDPSPSLCSEEKEDPDKIDETEEIQVNLNGKEKTKDEFNFHFKETYSKNSPVYENSYLDGNQENLKLEIKKDKEDKNLFFGFEKPLVTLLFDYKRWNRPLRYIKKKKNLFVRIRMNLRKFENPVRNEMSQYFFYTCRSDGKQKISFTYPPSLSTFFEMIQQKILLCTTEKLFSEELYNHWLYTNDQKRNNLSNELINRIETLNKGSLAIDALEKRTRLSNDKTKQKCLPKMYDPLLNGPHRGTEKILCLHSNFNSIENSGETFWINKLHDIFTMDYREFQGKMEIFDDKLFLLKRNEIKKEVPRWSHTLFSPLDELAGDEDEFIDEFCVRPRRMQGIELCNVKEMNRETKTTFFHPYLDDLFVVYYPEEVDFRHEIIKGSMRAQRRKIPVWKTSQTADSPLFLGRRETFLSKMLKIFRRIFKSKGAELRIYDYGEKGVIETPDEIRKEKWNRYCKEVKRRWENTRHGYIIRGSLLVTQSILRKYIVLPLLIIAKNLGRILFYQSPEWYEDFKEWKRERHFNCTYRGVQLAEGEFPRNWLFEGIHIKILCPFYLKPWRRSKSHHRHKTPKFSFLTIFGTETEHPFGYAQRPPSFFKPIWKHLQKKLKKRKNKSFPAQEILKERTKKFLKGLNEKTKWVMKIKTVQFIKRLMKEFAKVIPLFGLKEVYESNNLIISNQMIHESAIRIRSMDWTNFSPTEKKIKDLADKTSTIRNKIEKMSKDKKSIFISTDRNISLTETSCDNNNKRLESPKKIWQILKRRSARPIRKCHYFMNVFIERIYMDIFDIFLRIIMNIPRIDVEISLESKKQIPEKYSSNNETNKKRIKEKKKRIHFFSTKSKRKFIFNKNSQIFCDLSYLSQAYVFYKLSQTQVINKSHLKSIFQYHRTIPFIKDRIKNSIGTQGIFDYESRHKKLHGFGMNEWKGWLMGNDHYQYDLSQTIWSRLLPQKWRNGINRSFRVQKTNSTNFDSYEKDQLIHYEKQNNYAVNSLWSSKKKLIKNYKYDVLSNKYINYEYEDKKGSYIYGFPLQVNAAQGILYNRDNPEFDYLPVDIDLSNYLQKDSLIDRNKNTGRKYFDLRAFNFGLRKASDIEEWANVSTNIKKNTKTRYYYYKIIEKIDNNHNLLNLTIHNQTNPATNQTKTSFDWTWTGMNEKRLNRPISNREPWFLPESWLFYGVYKTEPWSIPIDLLLFTSNIKENNRTITQKLKKWLELELNLENLNQIELENLNQEKKQEPIPGYLGYDPLEDYLEENLWGSDSDVLEYIEETKYISRLMFKLFLKRYFFLKFQLKTTLSLSQTAVNNLKIYWLLLRLRDPEEMTKAFINRKEMKPVPLLIGKPEFLTFSNFEKGGLLIIEPTRLSTKWDGQWIMYQTIVISRVHKSQYQTNQRYQEKRNVDKKGRNDFIVPENILSPRRRRELRIQICLNSRNVNVRDRKQVFCNGNGARNCGEFFYEDQYPDVDTNKFFKLKLFLWPNYRLEDLACMNRYWFDTNNGSRFSMLRIHMYP
uniref:Protein TIC 214 n=2 Tax=Consolida TaxID=37493 RepID=A0A6H0CAD0_9MAGN|nr:hypothetical chloroplast RF19 [Consolida ajacis]YP_009763526.1 hypothetical chloroplast RF1 [Consolida orientalis]QBK49236.1 hypothetical chloroplast RF19 [Consolida ajacis]QIS63790.1 hypothetical chloroplast RF1 [Consolida orientalis]